MAPAVPPILSELAVQEFNAIIGQDLPIRILRGFIHKAAVPHALLFTGNAGVGKRTTARCFAMAINCNAPAPDARPCGQCLTCRQIAQGHHPDIIEVAPTKGIVRIDQVRKLLSTLTMQPFSAARRVVILVDAHTMNAEAGNALLKILEEPPANTIIILTALHRNDLLPTINSRCRHIRFNPLSSGDLATLLMDTKAIAREQAEAIAEAADGSFTKALNLSECRWHQRRDHLIRASGLDQPHQLKIRSAALALAFSALLAMHKENIDSDLEILETWIRDLSILPFRPKQIIHRDCGLKLAKAREGINQQQLNALWEAVEKAQKVIAANGNLRLTLDLMALRMVAAMAA